MALGSQPAAASQAARARRAESPPQATGLPHTKHMPLEFLALPSGFIKPAYPHSQAAPRIRLTGLEAG